MLTAFEDPPSRIGKVEIQEVPETFLCDRGKYLALRDISFGKQF